MENSQNTILRKTKKNQNEIPMENNNQVIRKIKLLHKNDNIVEKISTQRIKILVRKDKLQLKPKNPEINEQPQICPPILDESECSIEDKDEEIQSITDTQTFKSIKKTVIKLDPADIPQIERSTIVSEYAVTLKKNTSDEELSKEEMIEKVEYQRDILVKNHDKYCEKDYSLKLTTIDKLLSKLRGELDKINLTTMNDKRIQIDNIVLEKKIGECQFKQKIDLTGERDDKDPNMNLVTSSRKYFDKMPYLQPPPEIRKIDPKKNKNFGNQPMPPDLLKTINFS